MGLLGEASNFLQGASNAAASNVFGPVDMMAWALRKLGLPMGEPVGGSDWMARQGLTKPATGLGGLLGEAAGMSAPIVAAAKAPQIARGLLQAGENMAARPTMNPQAGAVVWHGSPHKFDAFDASKIGTGEGAQAYGHGLYLAESPGTASSYRGSVTKFDIPDGPVKGISTLIASRGEEGERLARQAYGANFTPSQLEEAIAQAKQVVDSQSHLYKVDLPDEHIAKMLDWDKPLSQQAMGVQKLFPPQLSDGALELSRQLRGLRKKTNGMSDAESVLFHNSTIRPIEARLGASADTSGRDIYGRVMEMMGDRPGTLANIGMPSAASWDGAKAAGFLKDAGIPGVRYLDGGSRGAGAGSSNFVVFPGNEGLLSILERNGVPLK